MTSQKSFKNNFGYAFITGLKSNIIWGVLEFLVAFVLLALNPISMLFKNVNINPETSMAETTNYKELYKVFFTSSEVLLLRYIYIAAFLFIGIALGISAFRFITGKKTVNVYYSLGIKRVSMFTAKFLSGAVVLFTAVIIPAFIGIIVNIAVLGNSKMIWMSGLYLALGVFSLSFFAFSLTAAVFSSVGTAFEGVLFSGTLIVLPHVFLSCVQWMIQKLVPGTPFGISFESYNYVYNPDAIQSLTSSFREFNPLLYFANGISTSGNVDIKGMITSYSSGDKVAWSTPDFLTPIIWILVSIAICAIGTYVFDKRKAEIGGFIGKNKVLNFVTTFIIGMFGFCYAFSVLSFSTITNLAISLAIFAVLYCIIDMLLIRNFKVFFKTIYKLPIHLGVAVVVFFFFSTGYFGFANRIPDISKIESADVSSYVQNIYGDCEASGGYVNFGNGYSSSSATSPTGSYKTEGDLKFVTELHKILVKDGNTSSALPDQTEYKAFPSSVRIIYTMKDGKKVYRNYYGISYQATKKLLEYDNTDSRKAQLTDLFKGTYDKDLSSKDVDKNSASSIQNFKENEYRKLLLSDESNIALYNKNLSTKFNLTTLTPAQRSALRDALYNDLAAQTTEQRYFPTETLGILSFQSMNGETIDSKIFSSKYVQYESTTSPDGSTEFDENGEVILPESEAVTTNSRLDFDSNPTYILTPDMVNTINFLKSINAFKNLSDTEQPVKISIDAIKTAFERTSYIFKYKYDVGTEFIASVMDYQKHSVSSSYEISDSAVMNSLLNKALLRQITDVNDYVVTVEHANKSQTVMYIKAKDVPDDIKKQVEKKAEESMKNNMQFYY